MEENQRGARYGKETTNYLSGEPGRFAFVFTPKHGSWLNIIEGFFSKFTRVFLRGIRVGTKEEVRERILRYIDEVNRNPTIIRWKYRMDDIILRFYNNYLQNKILGMAIHKDFLTFHSLIL